MEQQTLLQHSVLRLRGFLRRSPVDGRTPTGPRALKWQRLAEACILALLLPGERKSMQPMAARADVSFPEEWAGDPARRRRGGKFALSGA